MDEARGGTLKDDVANAAGTKQCDERHCDEPSADIVRYGVHSATGGTTTSPSPRLCATGSNSTTGGATTSAASTSCAT
eukprot:1722338-Pyramimonas_sp.AAC.1